MCCINEKDKSWVLCGKFVVFSSLSILYCIFFYDINNAQRSKSSNITKRLPYLTRLRSHPYCTVACKNELQKRLRKQFCLFCLSSQRKHSQIILKSDLIKIQPCVCCLWFFFRFILYFPWYVFVAIFVKLPRSYSCCNLFSRHPTRTSLWHRIQTKKSI